MTPLRPADRRGFGVPRNPGVPAAVLSVLLLVPAAGTGGPPGREAFAFTSLAGDARSAALGAGARAMAEGAGALYGNPGAAPLEPGYSVGVTHLAWTDGFFGETLTSLIPVGELAIVGAGAFVFLNDPVEVTSEIMPDGTGALARPLGVMATILGSSYLVEGFCFGGAARVVHEQYGDEMVEGMALDLGGIWFPDPAVTAGAAMRGFGGPIKPKATTDPFPLSFDLTVRWESWEVLPMPLRAYGGASLPVWGPMSGGVGVELGAWHGAFLRGMVELEERGNLGWAVGVGGRRDQWNVDYTFSPAGGLGGSHRIGLTLAFSRNLKPV